MPYPARTDAAAVIAAARGLIETEGPDQVTLAQVAAALGIRAPSLYHRFASREVLLRAVTDQLLTELGAAYSAAAVSAAAPAAQLLAICRAHRGFALANRRSYVFTFATPAVEPDQAARGPLLERTGAIFAALLGPEQVLLAQRGCFALVHGFVMLEIGGQLQLGGDLDATFDQLVAIYLAGLQATSLV